MKLFDLANFGNKATQKVTLLGNAFVFTSGNQGQVDISINGHVKTATFDTDTATTAWNFYRDNFAYYKQHGFLLTYDTGFIIVKSAYGWWSPNTIQITATEHVPTEASPTTTAAPTTTGGLDLTTYIYGYLEIDFHAARTWKITSGLPNVTVSDPIRPKHGDRIRLEFTNTAAGQIVFSSKWDFIGTDTQYYITNSAFSVVEGMYDETVDKVICDVLTHISITTTAAPTTTGPTTTL